MVQRLFGCVATMTVAFVASGLAPQGPDTSENAVLAAAASYVASYQRQMTSVLADESYSQQIVEQIPADPDVLRTRQMRSEIFFMFAPVRHDWMTIRDVLSVDGKATPDRPDLKDALLTLPALEVAATFKKYNSRYNIGRTLRNFNEPTISLLVLDDHHRGRFSFDRRRVERTPDATLVTLAFSEEKTPTLIRDPNGQHVFVKGEVVIEAGSGHVRRIQLNALHDSVRANLTTVYTADDHLGIWVPSRFNEDYERGTRPRAWSPAARIQYELVHCEAIYTNFRRFDTSARIK